MNHKPKKKTLTWNCIPLNKYFCVDAHQTLFLAMTQTENFA